MGGMAISTDVASMGGGGGAQSPVLRVIVENLFYPVTLDVLHQVLECLLHRNREILFVIEDLISPELDVLSSLLLKKAAAWCIMFTLSSIHWKLFFYLNYNHTSLEWMPNLHDGENTY